MSSRLKKITIVEKPGFRQGYTYRFAGQLMQPMTPAEEDAELAGEFTPVPITEAVDEELVIPPLNLTSLQRVKKELDGFMTGTLGDRLENLRKIIAVALIRNYSGVPYWLIEQTVDVANMIELSQAVADVSGLKRKEQEAEKKALAANSTGTTSTAT